MEPKINLMSIFKHIANWFKPKSPCCDKPMTSVLEMHFDILLYTCPDCGEEWV